MKFYLTFDNHRNLLNLKKKELIEDPNTYFSDIDDNLVLITTINGDVKLCNSNGKLIWTIMSSPKAVSARFFDSIIIIKYTNNTKEFRDYAGNIHVSIADD